MKFGNLKSNVICTVQNITPMFVVTSQIGKSILNFHIINNVILIVHKSFWLPRKILITFDEVDLHILCMMRIYDHKEYVTQRNLLNLTPVKSTGLSLFL